MTFKKNWVAAAVAAAAFTAPVFAHAAQNVLYRNDASIGTDYLGAALAASGDHVTQTSGSIAGVDLGAYDVVVYANQNNDVPGGDVDMLNAFVQQGGYVIFDDWTLSSLGGVSATGNINQTSLTIAAPFAAGLDSPLTLSNPGWGTFSTGLTAGAGDVVAGTFANGDAAIVIAGSGHLIYNGFLSDTLASSTLYANELNSLGVSAVPEPANLALLLAGIGMVGLVGRRRQAR